MTRLVHSFSNSKLSSQSGFSLLELAIVLVILGIVGGLTLPFLTAQMNRSAHLKTRNHQVYILDAIAAYVEKNGRFPCPSLPQGTNPTSGLAQDSCRGKKAKGLVPFKTLGISEVYSKDGYQRPMTYAIEPQLTQRFITLNIEPGGFLIVLNEEGIPVIPTPHPNEENPNYVAIVLISEGDPSANSSNPLSKGEKGERLVFQEKQGKNILRWESRDQFLKHYVQRP